MHYFDAAVPNIATSLASTATSNSLTITWDVPDSGLVATYIVELKNEIGAKKNVSASSVKTATFTGLDAGTQYTVVMVTASGDQRGDQVEKIFYTSKYTIVTVVLKKCVYVCVRVCLRVCVLVCVYLCVRVSYTFVNYITIYINLNVI